MLIDYSTTEAIKKIIQEGLIIPCIKIPKDKPELTVARLQAYQEVIDFFDKFYEKQNYAETYQDLGGDSNGR